MLRIIALTICSAMVYGINHGPVCPLITCSSNCIIVTGEHGCPECSCPDCSDVACNAIVCDGPSVTPPDHCCPVCPDCDPNRRVCDRRCLYNAVDYEHGIRFPDTDGCNTCSCDDGIVACSANVCDDCTTSPCAPLDCPDPLTAQTPLGECCPICGCIEPIGGTWRRIGETWNTGKCSTCSCSDSGIFCYIPTCRSPSNPIMVTGQCCPTLFDYSSLYGCDTLYTSCYPPPCITGLPQTPPGGCCAVCGCTDDYGIWHQNGERWMSDACTTCVCAGGIITCTSFCEDCVDVLCPIPTCNNPQIPPGQCCPACGCTEADGSWHLDGEEWHTGDCSSCRCNDGGMSCSTLTCGSAPCDIPMRVPGLCCPICDCIHVDCKPLTCLDQQTPHRPIGECCPVCGCTDHDGTWHRDGESWNTGTCSTCHCSDGTLNCRRKQCHPTNCPNPQTVPGHCCPFCHLDDSLFAFCISHDGIWYRNGESRNTSSCTTCSCNKGKLSCSPQQCPPTSCPNPQTVHGQCCPFCPGTDEATCDPDDLVPCQDVDACDGISCPVYPDAQCVSNNCGGCNAKFLDEDGNQLESRWSAFSKFGECSKPCGGGFKYKNRTCLQCGQTECAGPDQRRKKCNTQPCHVCNTQPCPVISTPCIYNGCEFACGVTFAATDDCNNCTCCNDGVVGCTEVACGPAPTERKTRKRCYENDQWYTIMDRWTYTEDGICFDCKCKSKNCKRRCKRVDC